MLTLSGMRRRGYTPAAIRNFCDRIGISKSNSVVQFAQLEDAVREDLNQHSPRVMAVLDPIKVVIENYPEGQVEEMDAVNNPEDPSAGTRKVPFSRELFIERTLPASIFASHRVGKFVSATPTLLPVSMW